MDSIAEANFDLQDKSGWTLLHWATYNGDTELVNILIQAGADRDSDNE